MILSQACNRSRCLTRPCAGLFVFDMGARPLPPYPPPPPPPPPFPTTENESTREQFSAPTPRANVTYISNVTATSAAYLSVYWQGWWWRWCACVCVWVCWGDGDSSRIGEF